MNNDNMHEVISTLKDLSIEFIGRVNDVAKIYDLDFMQCMIIQTAALTRPIIVAGREDDLKKIIHLGESENESY